MPSKKIVLRATAGGLYSPAPGAEFRPVMEWETDPVTQARRQSDRQVTDSNGVPLWVTDVVAQVVPWDYPETTIIQVQIAAQDCPDMRVLFGKAAA